MASFESQENLEEVPILPLHDPNYDYYSIDNILEEDLILKIKPVSTILQAKCLRESDEEGIIPSSTEMELPSWIAIPLIRNHLVELVEPKEFNHSFLWEVGLEIDL